MIKYPLTYIIDDDPIFVFAFKKNLLKIGDFQNIENIKNGEDALSDLIHLHSHDLPFPNIIFLDLNMPVTDGWQFLDEIENLAFKEKLIIYMISSTIDPRDIIRARDYSCVKQFISKPITLEKLMEILD